MVSTSTYKYTIFGNPIIKFISVCVYRYVLKTGFLVEIYLLFYESLVVFSLGENLSESTGLTILNLGWIRAYIKVVYIYMQDRIFIVW